MGIGEFIDDGIAFIGENPVGTAVGAGVAGAVVGSVVTGMVVSRSKKKRVSRRRRSRKTHSRIKHTKRGLKQDRKRRSKQSWEVAYQKRKRKNSGGKRRGKIYYARKTGQPYIILSNGRAKFIKGKRRK